MPATLNHWCSQPDPLIGVDTVDAPSCSAAVEPSAATGSRAVPSLSQLPRAMPVFSTDGRFRLVART